MGFISDGEYYCDRVLVRGGGWAGPADPAPTDGEQDEEAEVTEEKDSNPGDHVPAISEISGHCVTWARGKDQ